MIFLSSEAQSNLQTGHRILFGVSSVFNAISLFCMIKETPPHQAKIRNYLLMTQVAVIVSSCYTDILLEPIPLLPALAGICTGILCRAGIPPHTVLGGLIIVYIWLGVSIFFCCYFRYQTLLPESDRLSTLKSRLIIVFVLLSCNIPATGYALFPFESSRLRHTLITSRYGLGWVIERGPYFMHERSTLVLFFITVTISLVVGSFFIFLAIFIRMFQVLRRNVCRILKGLNMVMSPNRQKLTLQNSRSRVTIQKIHRSLFILFVQLCIPLVMLELPAVIMFSGLLNESIPFEVNLILFSMMMFHPLVHNVTLLAITPTYRRIFTSLPCRDRKGSRVGERKTTVSMPPMELRRMRGPSLAWTTPASWD